MPLTSDADSVPFRLYYPATAVNADNTYQVSSQILSDGGLFFQSEPTPLTVNQNQFADITLPLSAVMTASETLRGALVYQYGTTSLMLCNTDRRLQLAGPQREDLIDAYRAARNYPLQPRVVTVSGLLRKVPGEQEGSTQNGIIVESFSLESRNDNCRLPRADLINTRWQLSALGNEILDPASQQAPYLTLDSEGKVRGHAGCNGLNGSYQHDDDSLSFGAIATTRKACPDMEGEQAFLQALKASRQFRIDGELLTLFDANNQPLAGFQAIAL
jgi:putative lipoprotein